MPLIVGSAAGAGAAGFGWAVHPAVARPA